MPFYIIIILASFIVSLGGLLLIKQNRVFPLILFSGFLFMSFSAEFYANQMAEKNQNNILFYNLFTFFEFIFYLFFFWLIFPKGRIRKTIIVVIFIYTLLGFANIFFIQGTKIFHSYTYVLGCILIVVFSTGYLYFLFNSPETTGLTNNPYFWIAAGLMFYYTCTFSLFGLENFIAQTMKHYSRLLLMISDLLNVLLYSIFTTGFLCRLKIRKLLPLL